MMPTRFYLFARRGTADGRGTEDVFYKTGGEGVAEILCGMFKKEYGEAARGTEFRFAAVDSKSTQDQVLLDESLECLEMYDDPDPGIYEPEPSRETMVLAQYKVRARVWEDLLLARNPRAEAGGTEKAPGGNGAEPLAGSGMEGMPAEDQRNAMLGLLMLLAQAYYRTLEAAVSMANVVSALDLELNHSYLWAVKNLQNLLVNSPELKDFPIQFKPAVPNLFPSTIRDMDWEDGIGPEAEGFLSAVQEYVMEKGICDPEEGSSAWCFTQMFRPGVEKALERATAYRKRMATAWQKMMGSEAQESPDSEEGGTSMPPPPAKATSAAIPTATEFIRGKLRCSASYEVVNFNGVAYNLHTRKKARLCLQYLFENGAFDAVSAKHLIEEIDPFVRERGGYSRANEIKIQHYFNSEKEMLPELCKQLIAVVPGKGRYFLKVE